jgi:hypothetical protein
LGIDTKSWKNMVTFPLLAVPYFIRAPPSPFPTPRTSNCTEPFREWQWHLI